MEYSNINLELFKKSLETKKEMVKESFDSSLEGFRREAIANELDKLNYCLEAVNTFQEGLADDEMEKKLKLNDE